MSVITSATCLVMGLIGLVVAVTQLVRKSTVLLHAVRTLIDAYRALFR